MSAFTLPAMLASFMNNRSYFNPLSAQPDEGGSQKVIFNTYSR